MEKVVVIIPAFNEELSIAKVIQEIPRNMIEEIIVVNNNSTDRTAEIATKCGATTLHEPIKGYGKACLRGLDYLAQKNEVSRPDIVVFLDGDYSDYPDEMNLLLEPILKHDYDMVIGSRTKEKRQRGAMMPHQRFGNWLATSLINWIWKIKFTDLGPFRAITYGKLLQLNMQDTNYGWTVEMQVKGAKQKLKCKEVPVSYRKRTGKSKITGTIKGSILAGWKILTTIFKHAF